MTNHEIIKALIKGNKVDQPIELTVDQLFLLEIARDTKVARSSVGTVAFFAIAGFILGIISLIF